MATQTGNTSFIDGERRKSSDEHHDDNDVEVTGSVGVRHLFVFLGNFLVVLLRVTPVQGLLGLQMFMP